MKKTFYYNFYPTKEEEEAALSNPNSQPSRTLVEINDVYPRTQPDPNDPWVIKKVVQPREIQSRKLVLPHNDAFEHVFRYWTVDSVNIVLNGRICYTSISDFNDPHGLGRRYEHDGIYLRQEANNGDNFLLGWKELVQARRFNPGDEIGLYWDDMFKTFQFKLLRQYAASS